MIHNAAPESWRLFLAISIPEQVKDELVKAQDQFRGAVGESGVRWTRHEHLHLTLKFLGNVEAQRTPELSTVVSSLCHGFAPLRLRAEGVGFFPDTRSPRVIWAGVTDAVRQLECLQQALEERTLPFTNEEPGEKFIGHVTLGRAKRLNKQQAQALARMGSAMVRRIFGDWTSDSVEIMRSELSSAGPRHSCFASALLGGDGPQI
jgi:2'-5' RNA ligase